jgi:TatD DNase family protein
MFNFIKFKNFNNKNKIKIKITNNQINYLTKNMLNNNNINNTNNIIEIGLENHNHNHNQNKNQNQNKNKNQNKNNNKNDNSLKSNTTTSNSVGTNFEKDKFKLFDIAANLSDEKYQGIYNGKKYHEDDTLEVIRRAESYGVKNMLFASGTIEDLHISYKLSKLSEGFYTTLGIHPCRASVKFKFRNN